MGVIERTPWELVMNIIPIRQCICGKPGQPRMIVCETEEGTLSASFVSCDECLDRSEKFLARVRPVFDKMIECGVPGDIANETMTYLLDQLPDDDMLKAEGE